jgi:hypothetical protein
MKSYMKMCDKLLVLILCVWYHDVSWCLGGLAWRQTPSRFSGWWQLGCQSDSQVVFKHQLGAPRLCWAKHPNKRGCPIITGLWVATAWVLDRAGHSQSMRLGLITCSCVFALIPFVPQSFRCRCRAHVVGRWPAAAGVTRTPSHALPLLG